MAAQGRAPSGELFSRLFFSSSAGSPKIQMCVYPIRSTHRSLLDNEEPRIRVKARGIRPSGSFFHPDEVVMFGTAAWLGERRCDRLIVPANIFHPSRARFFNVQSINEFTRVMNSSCFYVLVL